MPCAFSVSITAFTFPVIGNLRPSGLCFPRKLLWRSHVSCWMLAALARRASSAAHDFAADMSHVVRRDSRISFSSVEAHKKMCPERLFTTCSCTCLLDIMILSRFFSAMGNFLKYDAIVQWLPRGGSTTQPRAQRRTTRPETADCAYGELSKPPFAKTFKRTLLLLLNFLLLQNPQATALVAVVCAGAPVVERAVNEACGKARVLLLTHVGLEALPHRLDGRLAGAEARQLAVDAAVGRVHDE